MTHEWINVEVVYALPDRQYLLPLDLPTGSTVKQAIQASGILELRKDIDLDQQKVGLYGKLTKLEAILHSGDRVEIYRPLIADPKELRRQRASRG